MNNRDINLVFVVESKSVILSDFMRDITKRYEESPCQDRTRAWEKELLEDICELELRVLDLMKDCWTVGPESIEAKNRLEEASKSLDKMLGLLYEIEGKLKN